MFSYFQPSIGGGQDQGDIPHKYRQRSKSTTSYSLKPVNCDRPQSAGSRKHKEHILHLGVKQRPGSCKTDRKHPPSDEQLKKRRITTTSGERDTIDSIIHESPLPSGPLPRTFEGAILQAKTQRVVFYLSLNKQATDIEYDPYDFRYK